MEPGDLFTSPSMRRTYNESWQCFSALQLVSLGFVLLIITTMIPRRYFSQMELDICCSVAVDHIGMGNCVLECGKVNLNLYGLNYGSFSQDITKPRAPGSPSGRISTDRRPSAGMSPGPRGPKVQFARFLYQFQQFSSHLFQQWGVSFNTNKRTIFF